MLNIDSNGMIANSRIKLKRFMTLERDEFDGRLQGVHAIIVHQTDTLIAPFGSYSQKNANGSHFVIDKDGTIYQTASLYHQVDHVGLIQARCLEKHACTDVDKLAFEQMKLGRRSKKRPNQAEYKAIHLWEKFKPYPVRFPANLDSIGIEIVSKAYNPDGSLPVTDSYRAIFEPVNDVQNQSLRWLVGELKQTLGRPTIEILPHPRAGRKNPDEASSAKWR